MFPNQGLLDLQNSARLDGLLAVELVGLGFLGAVRVCGSGFVRSRGRKCRRDNQGRRK
jgi:hypothetical protein